MEDIIIRGEKKLQDQLAELFLKQKLNIEFLDNRNNFLFRGWDKYLEFLIAPIWYSKKCSIRGRTPLVGIWERKVRVMINIHIPDTTLIEEGQHLTYPAQQVRAKIKEVFNNNHSIQQPELLNTVNQVDKKSFITVEQYEDTMYTIFFDMKSNKLTKHDTKSFLCDLIYLVRENFKPYWAPIDPHSQSRDITTPTKPRSIFF